MSHALVLLGSNIVIYMLTQLSPWFTTSLDDVNAASINKYFFYFHVYPCKGKYGLD